MRDGVNDGRRGHGRGDAWCEAGTETAGRGAVFPWATHPWVCAKKKKELCRLPVSRGSPPPPSQSR